MNRTQLFKKAQKIAEGEAEKLNCSSLIQSGSSLRKEDFTGESDLDLLAIFDNKTEEGWDYNFEGEVEVSILKESKEEFMENLEEGNAFELMALKFGKVLKDDGFLNDLERSEYKPTQQTIKTWIRSGLNQYSRMIMDRDFAIDFQNAAYHSFRSFSRILILEESGKLVERDKNIRRELKDIDKKYSKEFWLLRNKRFDPPDLEYIELKELEGDERFETIEKVERLGQKVLSKKGKEFPSFSKLNGLLKEKGYEMLGSFVIGREKATISGSKKGEYEIFEFDMENGRLKPIEG